MTNLQILIEAQNHAIARRKTIKALQVKSVYDAMAIQSIGETIRGIDYTQFHKTPLLDAQRIRRLKAWGLIRSYQVDDERASNGKSLMVYVLDEEGKKLFSKILEFCHFFKKLSDCQKCNNPLFLGESSPAPLRKPTNNNENGQVCC